MKAVLGLVLVMVSTSAMAFEINCEIDVYGQDSQKVGKLHQDVRFERAGDGEIFEYSEVIKVLPNLKVACGRKSDSSYVGCSFEDKDNKALSSGSTDGVAAGMTTTFEDQRLSIASGYSNTIVTCSAR